MVNRTVLMEVMKATVVKSETNKSIVLTLYHSQTMSIMVATDMYSMLL